MSMKGEVSAKTDLNRLTSQPQSAVRGRGCECLVRVSPLPGHEVSPLGRPGQQDNCVGSKTKEDIYRGVR